MLVISVPTTRGGAAAKQRCVSEITTQLMSGSLFEIFDRFPKWKALDAPALRAELAKLDLRTTCRIFERCTGYCFTEADFGTTTVEQQQRFDAFLLANNLSADDGVRAFHGTDRASAEAICRDQLKPGYRDLYGQGGYVALQLKDALQFAPCDADGVVSVVYGFAQTGQSVADGAPGLADFGKDASGLPVHSAQDESGTLLCLKSPGAQFLPCGRLHFVVKRKPRACVLSRVRYHSATWARMRQRFPSLRARERWAAKVGARVPQARRCKVVP